MVHDLQQHVENVGMRFLDFVQQQNSIGVFGDGFGQKSALLETDIAWRRADQTGDCVALHVFGHVEADQFDAKGISQLPCDFGFSDAGRAGKQEGTDGFLRIAKTGTGHLDR